MIDQYVLNERCRYEVIQRRDGTRVVDLRFN